MANQRALRSSDPVHMITPLWIEKRIVNVFVGAYSGLPPKDDNRGYTFAAVERNLPLALTALMQLARLKGYVVEKKASVALRSKVTTAELLPLLQALDPAAAAEIAAGTFDATAEPE